MTDSKYPVSGSIRIWWTPANGVANYKAPTEAELAVALDLSDAISWNDKDFGIQASSTTSDPAITARGNTQTRGAAQYGGSLSFYYPGDLTDVSNHYKVVWDALHKPRTEGYLFVRVDGLELATEEGTASQPGTKAEDGDLLTPFRVQTAGYTEEITGEEAFRYTISFLARGEVEPFAVVRASATPVPPVVTGSDTVTAGSRIVLNGTLLGREYTRGLRWTSSNPSVATVSRNGVVTGHSSGTADIIATDTATGTPSTAHEVTVS